MANTILNLPKLRDNSGFVNIDQPGTWVSTNINLSILAQSLPVSDQQAFVDPDEPVRAVPDPWAQARSFGEALINPDHSLHERSLRQWRGLLAIMALRSRHKGEYILRPWEVALNDKSKFSAVMTTLTPEIAIDGAGDLWRKPSLIMMHDPQHDPNALKEQPLAMTNPICLISPGRRSAAIIVPKVYWAQGDLTSPLDPKAKGTLAPAELALLQAWLVSLRKSVQDINDDVAAKISHLLRDYAIDVGNAMGPKPLTATVHASIERGIEPLYQALWNDPEIDENREPHSSSQTQIDISAWSGDEAEGQQFSDNLKGFILVDPAVASALNMDANHILIWGTFSLGELLKSPEKLADVRKQAADSGYIVVTADDLFTRRAVRLGNKAQIPSHPAGLQQMILPVRPLALMLGGNLQDRIKGKAGSNSAAITLNVRIKAGHEDGTPVAITRHFTKSPVDDEGLLVDSIETAIYNAQVWPDFKSPAWHAYLGRFLYPSHMKSKMPRPVQAVSLDLMQHLVARARDSGNAITALLAANRGEPLQLNDNKLLKRTERTTGENGSYIEEVHYSSLPFDALVYKEGEGDHRPEAAAGLVLLNQRRIERPSTSTKVAIDFGTTNTVACFGDNTAEPVTFANRLMLPVRFEGQQIQNAAMHSARFQLTGFMPPDERKAPIPSVAIPKEPYNAQETLWAFRNLIYFHTSQPPSDGEEQEELKNFQEATRGAEFELKWSPKTRVREAATDFLTQFMVMSAAELVNANYDPSASEWMFSVPEAMSKSARNQFSDSLQNAAMAIGKKPDSKEFSVLLSEGLSAACYMLSSKKFSADGLNIILDIGGGTTDITIWDRENAVWKGSIFLAGGNFFTELLVQNRQILSEIGLESWAKSLDPANNSGAGDTAKRRKQLAEMLFSGRASQNNGPDLESAMNDHWNNRLSAELGAPLRHAALVYLGGLAWYLGKVVKELVRNDIVSAERAHNPAFAVCGRGGGIFRRMHGNREADAQTPVTDTLGVYAKALGDECKYPSFSASPAPKLEVVRGMLTENRLIDKRSEGMEGLGTLMPQGLGVTYSDGHKVDPDDLLADDPHNMSVEKVDMSEFTAFLDTLSDVAGIHINFVSDSREGGENKIADDVRTRIEELRTESADAEKTKAPRQSMEAPFLIALRALVDRMALQTNERNKIISVQGDD